MPLFGNDDARQVLERAGDHVRRRLRVPDLDDVGRAAAGKRRVELRAIRAPRLILDVDVPARVLVLELRVGRGDDVRPAGLRVDHQPDGERVGCLATGRSRGTNAPRPPAPQRARRRQKDVRSFASPAASWRPSRPCRMSVAVDGRGAKWFIPICHAAGGFHIRCVCQAPASSGLLRDNACSAASEPTSDRV